MISISNVYFFSCTCLSQFIICSLCVLVPFLPPKQQSEIRLCRSVLIDTQRAWTGSQRTKCRGSSPAWGRADGHRFRAGRLPLARSLVGICGRVLFCSQGLASSLVFPLLDGLVISVALGLAPFSGVILQLTKKSQQSTLLCWAGSEGRTIFATTWCES